MKLVIDEVKNSILVNGDTEITLYSPEGFRLISDLWVKIGWDQKYLYSFTWLGRPLIQIPEDVLRFQEVVYQVKPDVIFETGIAHGGSLVFSASLCKMIGKGRVIGADIEIRPHNRKAIENHELASYITLLDGDSVDSNMFERVRGLIGKDERVLVVLDSCHDYSHVLKELQLYSTLVSKDSYIIATDGSQEYLNVTPRSKKDYPNSAGWEINNPKRAALEFVKTNSGFVIDEPKFPFNEGNIDFRITHWPSAYIRKV